MTCCLLGFAAVKNLPPLQVIEDKMDIRGGYAKPKWTDVLWVQLFLLPLTACRWSYFYGRWLWKFGICRQGWVHQSSFLDLKFDLRQISSNLTGFQIELWINLSKSVSNPITKLD